MAKKNRSRRAREIPVANTMFGGANNLYSASYSSPGFNDSSKKKEKPKERKQGFIGRPLCPFCSEPWTDEMISIEDLDCSAGCDTCGYGGRITGQIRIFCHNPECKRLIYVKEFRKEY